MTTGEKQKSRFGKRSVSIVIVLTCVCALTFGTILYVNTRQQTSASENKNGQTIPQYTQIVRADADTPIEIKPTKKDIEEYPVPPEQPKKIVIPSIGADGLIQQVGKTESGRVVVPNNIHFAGWFHESALPGEPGLSIIGGHLSGTNQEGIFFSLRKLRLGERFYIELGSSEKKYFEVVEVLQLPTEKANNELFNKRLDIDSQLNLITCGGGLTDDQQNFKDRVIVVSRFVGT